MLKKLSVPLRLLFRLRPKKRSPSRPWLRRRLKRPICVRLLPPRLHRGETLAFAKAAMLPDGGTDVNGTVIVPKALAMFCNLSSEEALSSGKLDECLLNLNKERKSAQLFSGSDAPKVYNRALAQYVAASIAEAYKALQDAESFEEKFVDAVDFAPEPTAQDIYANIVELNKAVDMQMNGLLKVYSTQLAAQALFNYGGYLFVPEEKETGDNDV